MNPVQLQPTSPKLIDLALSGINAKISARLSWLSCYGAAVRQINEAGFYPAIPTESNNTQNYLSMLPDYALGTYSFWDIQDGASVEKKGDFIHLKFNAGLVVFGKISDVFGTDWIEKNTMNVADAVLAALQLQNFGSSRLQFSKMYFEAANIYKGYSHNEIKNQFLKRPYFGLRIDCDIVSQQKCP